VCGLGPADADAIGKITLARYICLHMPYIIARLGELSYSAPRF
jgi:hypothetical protein